VCSASGTCFGIGHCEDLEGCGDIRYHPGLFVMMEVGMSLLSSATVLRLVDSMARGTSKCRPRTWAGQSHLIFS
jgi:hypothetical protein